MAYCTAHSMADAKVAGTATLHDVTRGVAPLGLCRNTHVSDLRAAAASGPEALLMRASAARVDVRIQFNSASSEMPGCRKALRCLAVETNYRPLRSALPIDLASAADCLEWCCKEWRSPVRQKSRSRAVGAVWQIRSAREMPALLIVYSGG